jgi:hypothetical protein
MRAHLALAALMAALTPTHAFVGLGVSMYNSICSDSCRRSINAVELVCPPGTEMDHSAHGAHGGHRHHVMPGATPECRARNVPYLTTLALCVQQYCAADQVAPSDVPTSETYWAKEMTGDPAVPAMWSYGEALGRSPAREGLAVYNARTASGPLNETVLLDVSVQISSQNAFEDQEELHAKYA